MSKCYALEEVRAIRDEISRLGERKFNELEAELNKARTERDNAATKMIKIMAEWDRAMAEYNKAKAEWDTRLFDILTLILPEARYHWEGYITIPKDDNENWILPVFTGRCRDAKHQAFSIWTIPKNSCNGSDAREVKDE